MSYLQRTVIPICIMVTMVALMLWSCSSKRVGPPGPDGKKLTWKEMNVAQRQAHMKTAVLPIADSLFRSWRPERYARVDCSLCHGLGADIGIYDMPTNHLPRLSGELLLGPEFKKHPETTRLKMDRLVPEMAEALGVKKFSLLTRNGFGCYSCHLGPDGPEFGN